ncbi:hypothetical protein BC826DRAFT_1039903 [Russula brevipes]|nr:hypothetical protein BC826DRAFT_1039903 [Russula brevipes]
MVQTNVEDQFGISKTIYADCSSHRLRSQDAGSPGDTHISLYPVTVILMVGHFSCVALPSTLVVMAKDDNPGKGTHPHPQTRGTYIGSGFSLCLDERHCEVSTNARDVYEVIKASLRLRNFISFLVTRRSSFVMLTRPFPGNDCNWDHWVE